MATVVDDTDPQAPPVEKPPHRRTRVGEALPAVLELKDLADVLNLGFTRTYELYRRGDFNFAVLKPEVGDKPRFSGKKVQAWLDGELNESGARPVFGRKRPR